MEKFFWTESHICEKVSYATNVLRVCLVFDFGMYTRLLGIGVYPVCNMSLIYAHRILKLQICNMGVNLLSVKCFWHGKVSHRFLSDVPRMYLRMLTS